MSAPAATSAPSAGASVARSPARCRGAAACTDSWTFGDRGFPNLATFAGIDTTTQGNWNGSYGNAGYEVIGASASLPTYATVTASGQSAYTWASTTTDPRALEVPGSTSKRIAACWYSATTFSINVNLTDGLIHPVSLYALDWDNVSRVEQIQVINAATGAVLDTESLSSFAGGEYLNWNVGGNVTFQVTCEGPYNAVVSGVFIGSAANPLAPSHLYVNPGTYTAKLTATDSAGHTGSSSAIVTVADVAPAVSLTLPSLAIASVAASFSANATDISPAVQAAGFTYSWNFGDGGSATGAAPSHTFKSAGSYNVAVTATDEYGLSGTANATIVVDALATTFSLAAPAQRPEWQACGRIHLPWDCSPAKPSHHR